MLKLNVFRSAVLAGPLCLTRGNSSEVLLKNHEAIRLVQTIVQPKVLAEEGLELRGRPVVRDFRRCESFLLCKCSDDVGGHSLFIGTESRMLLSGVVTKHRRCTVVIGRSGRVGRIRVREHGRFWKVHTLDLHRERSRFARVEKVAHRRKRTTSRSPYGAGLP